MQWSPAQVDIIDHVKSIESIPKNDRRYKCFACAISFDADTTPNVNKPTCPRCGSPEIRQMCPLDHLNCGKYPQQPCYHTKVFPFAETCPICREQICPGCGSHDVEVMSRVTGYLQDLSGWNNGKRQEFRDRVRYSL